MEKSFNKTFLSHGEEARFMCGGWGTTAARHSSKLALLS